MKKSILVMGMAVAMMTASPLSQAQAPQDETTGFRFLLTAGITEGGDKLAEVEYRHGDSSDVKAGGLILLGGGFGYQFGEGWEVQSTINYHFTSASARNGDVDFSRVPIDVLGFYRAGNHRFGGGATYHINPQFSIDTDDENFDVDFDDALGWVLEYDYFFTPSISLGLRYTNIEYESSQLSEKIDGSHGGLIFNYFF